ncbi:MAG: PHP domain-containing protein [Lachnospiraceae bacterium]|jgi:ABC-type cobalamin/Fe3+-siderophores transport system ATPase subunit|nr:PHP domain-containing protein [Lachnospiraceae bacterium]
MALAKWYKVDFHTHTPASNCFVDKTVTAEQWVVAAKEANLDAVVITDHNSVGFISKIDELEESIKDGIKIFYGIEVCVSANFTHFLIIFDDKLKTKEIEDAVISDLGLKRDVWADTTNYVSEDNLKKLYNELGNRIFVIPAHFASEKGLGKSNINAINKYQEFLKFDAIEVRSEEDIREYENKIRNDAINKAALITGSDNPSDKNNAQHSLEGVGKSFTWIKTSSLTFEGLRQVFLDPKNRCINMVQLQNIGEEFNPNEITYDYVSGIKFSKITHMTELDMRFSPGLNCIIGGRGTGKSTLVEAIHYGLKTKKELSDCKLLDKTLMDNGVIETFYNFGMNKSYKITAVRKRRKIEYTYEDDNGNIKQPPEFKIDFYGQKEIFNLIECNENHDMGNVNPILNMIDSRINSKIFSYKEEVNTVLSEMKQYAIRYKNNQKNIEELPTIKAEIEKAEAILKRFKASGLEDARKKYETLGDGIKRTKQELSSLSQLIDCSVENFTVKRAECESTLKDLSRECAQNKENIAVIDELLKSYSRIAIFLSSEKEKIDSQINSYEFAKVHGVLNDLKNLYTKALESIKAAESVNIREVQDKLQEYKKREKQLKEVAENQKNILEKIKVCIDKFIIKHIELTQLRMTEITKLELEGIKVSIQSMAYLPGWKSALQKELGTAGFDDDFMLLGRKIFNPDSMYENYKKFLMFILVSSTGDLTELGLEEFATRFVNMWKTKSKNGTLESLINIVPEDNVDITITENGLETDINEGSPGQKCAALLAFILNSGNNPLVIDQPEDDLDNSLIYNLIVKSIREIKKKRQIIIVTHNPNIPVLGDAEGIFILERNAQGKVVFRKNKKAGCIEEKEIRNGICEIMEGGEEAFKKREAKYMY